MGIIMIGAGALLMLAAVIVGMLYKSKPLEYDPQSGRISSGSAQSKVRKDPPAETNPAVPAESPEKAETATLPDATETQLLPEEEETKLLEEEVEAALLNDYADLSLLSEAEETALLEDAAETELLPRS
ncbi:MAG: hypothetical protein IJH77_02890 [Mogibacterium sp.]|nr:hypothetical protein [Mogibacterium sp.]